MPIKELPLIAAQSFEQCERLAISANEEVLTVIDP
jgi:hypothetical protein